MMKTGKMAWSHKGMWPGPLLQYSEGKWHMDSMTNHATCNN